MFNIKILSVLLVLVFSLTATARSQGVAKLPAKPATAQPAAAPSQGVILSNEEGQAAIRHQCSRGVPQDVTDFWVPTLTDIQKLEDNFKKCVHAQDVIDLSKVKRQYAGFLRKKTKFIYVNAAQNDSSPLTAQALIVCDGGPNFFGFEYDLTNQTFSEFQFNGMGGSPPAGYTSHSFTCPKK